MPTAHALKITSADRVVLGLILFILGAGVFRTLVVPGHLHPWFNPALAAAVVAFGVAAGLGTADLGLDPDATGSGLRWGLAAATVIAVGIALATLIPATRDLMADSRADVAFDQMLWKVLVVIPLGTVLIEELMFRGLLVGLLDRRLDTLATLVVGGLVFGSWHVLPAWRGAADASLSSSDGPIAAAAVTMVATTLAGVAFTWLRLRSGSLVASALAHVATNSLAFLAAWSVLH